MSTKMISTCRKKKRTRVIHSDNTELDINIQTPKRKSQRFVRLEDLTSGMPMQNKNFTTIDVTNSDSGTLVVNCQNDDDEADMSTQMTSMSMKKKRSRVVCSDNTKLDINIQTPKRKSQRFVRLEDLATSMPTQNENFVTIGVTNSNSGTLVNCHDDED